MGIYDIEDLYGRGEIQHPFLWKVSIPQIPATVGGNGRNLEIQAREVPIPGVSNEVVEVQYGHAKVKYYGRVDYDGNISIPYLVVEDRKVYNALRAWVNAGDHESFGNGLPTNLLKTTIFLRSYAKDGADTITSQYRLLGAFPSEIGSLTGGQGERGEMTFDCTFQYDIFLTDK